ncbi:MAG: hypothetical protein MJZ20_11730, partial [Bacteroidaceae bacterium]|nr:hypothetical protein [Bacteroidaceae bacterium]
QQHEDERQQHEDERQQHEDERQQHEVERQQRENERQQHEDERQQHENERQQHENERQQHENECQLQENDNKQNNDYFRNHDVKVESSEVIILKDGSRMRIYDATVDGHEAIFLGDEDRHIVGAVIDENGNGTPEENELVDLRQYNITEQQLYVHHVEEPTHDVDVIAVEHDVLIDGQLTDVATVTIDDQPVLFIDANQNGEVDLAITDQNQNDQIDEGEIEDISGYHIAMPTEDDVTGTLLSSAGDNTDDYSNDANVELYEV